MGWPGSVMLAAQKTAGRVLMCPQTVPICTASSVLGSMDSQPPDHMPQEKPDTNRISNNKQGSSERRPVPGPARGAVREHRAP